MKKFLLIRFSSIGDIVLTTPVIRCLRKQFPEADIHYITKEQFLPVLEANPHLDKVHVIRDDIDEVLPRLKKERFDHIIDLHKNIRSRRLCLHLGMKCSSFDKINFKKWLAVNFKVDRLPDVHVVDRYFGAVAGLRVANDQAGLEYFIPEDEEDTIDWLPEPHRSGFIAWAIGGNHNTKVYPEESIAEVCSSISRPVVLLGGEEDADRGDRIAAAAGSHVFNASGKSTLNQSASLVSRADLVLTNDTGMMHVAAAFRKKIISFWGNTIPAFGMYPYMPGNERDSYMLEVNGLSCRPCSKLGYGSCPKGHFRCMKEIGTEQVIRTIEKALG